jgi:hypothetical protein
MLPVIPLSFRRFGVHMPGNRENAEMSPSEDTAVAAERARKYSVMFSATIC